MHIPQTRGMRGGVKVHYMKHPTALQALLNIQAYSKYLRVYIRIGLLERRKLVNAVVKAVAR
jgi:hypothetical protein